MELFVDTANKKKKALMLIKEWQSFKIVVPSMALCMSVGMHLQVLVSLENMDRLLYMLGGYTVTHLSQIRNKMCQTRAPTVENLSKYK